MRWIILASLYIAATAGLIYLFLPFVGRFLYSPQPVKVLDWASNAMGLYGMENFMDFVATVALVVSLLLALFAMRYVKRIARLSFLLWKYRSR